MDDQRFTKAYNFALEFIKNITELDNLSLIETVGLRHIVSEMLAFNPTESLNAGPDSAVKFLDRFYDFQYNPKLYNSLLTLNGKWSLYGEGARTIKEYFQRKQDTSHLI